MAILYEHVSIKSNKRRKLQFSYLRGGKLLAIQSAKKPISIHLIFKLNQNTVSFFHTIIPKNSIRGHQPRAQNVKNKKSNQNCHQPPFYHMQTKFRNSITPMIAFNAVNSFIQCIEEEQENSQENSNVTAIVNSHSTTQLRFVEYWK